MEKEKENGYVERTQTETTATADMGVGGERNCPNSVSTALGKFKDVDALLKAYDCLQAEFTRRSQRLKQLERERENYTSEGGTHGAVEKLRRNAEKARRDEEKFDGFIAEIEGANVRALSKDDPSPVQPVAMATEGEDVRETPVQTDRDSSKTAESVRADGDRVEEVGGKVRESEGTFVAESRKAQPPSFDELYRFANANEEVRLKIIGEYLHSVGKSGAPLVKGGNGLLSAPPLKAKTVREAGEMALCWLKSEWAKS